MIAVTCANGRLGRATLKALQRRVAADKIVAMVRDIDKAADLKAQGFVVRRGDFDDSPSLISALRGVERCLIISANVPTLRVAQHSRAIAAAQKTGVSLIAYTSLLHADTSTSQLAQDHLATEALVRAAKVPFVLLRNGWYLENYEAPVTSALTTGVLTGCAQHGRVAAAARADYAAAAAAVLTEPGHMNKTYELAGDTAFSMAQLAQATAARCGKPIAYTDLDASAYRAALAAQMPKAIADLLVSADASIAHGDLDDDTHQLSRLIGRPTQTLAGLLAQLLPTPG